MISEESFEPTVMFFGLTNSPTIFQTIMNEILWNLINIEVTSFIDNIIVETEEKERHNKVVEKVVKKLAKNNLNLYVKLEKYKWKIRRVGFLGVVIELGEIKIEEEKIKEVLDWPTPKGVKDIQKFLKLVNYY